MVNTQAIDFKRGATFSVQATYKDSTGAPINLTGITITSSVRDVSDTLVLSLTCTPLNQSTNAGQYTISGGSTAAWPVGELEWDIQYSTGGVITYTETLTLNMITSVTGPQ